MKPSRVALFTFLILTAHLTAKDATVEDYQKRVEAADLNNHPEKHKDLAAWCKRNFPGKFSLHEKSANEYQFAQLEKSLARQPMLSALLDMSKKAEALGLDAKAREYRERWGTTQFSSHELKIKKDDATQMKKLLAWAETENISSIEPCEALCRRIIAMEPDFQPARRALGEFQFKGEWMDFATGLSKINLKSPEERMTLHKALSTGATPADPKTFPLDPFRDWTKSGNYWEAKTKTTGGTYLVWATGYNRSKPCPLVISLHGGGKGATPSREYAGIGMDMWCNNAKDGSYVVLAPVATNHVDDSWHQKGNFDEFMEALSEVRKKFNIDMTRIYLTGQSMGAGGTGAWMWYFPELAAAYCGRAGAYATYENPKDLLKKPIMIIHGEKDEDFRNRSRDLFIQKTEAIGGVVEHISLPDAGHFIYARDIMPRMLPYFTRFQSDCAPDMRIIQALADKYLKK